MRTRILEDHIKDCYALKYTLSGDWATPWSPSPEEIIWRDTLCRQNGTGTTWIVFRCNCLKCPARIAVYADDILVQFPKRGN